LKYPAIFFEDGEYIGVEFPDLSGCFSQGKDLAEAETNAQKALAEFLSVHETLPPSRRLEEVAKSADTLAIKLVGATENSDDSHELLYNAETNKLITFPKNQDYLGDKLTRKVKAAAGL